MRRSPGVFSGLSLCSSRFFTVKAIIPVDTERGSAVRADPASIFQIHKGVQSLIPDEFQVVDHAHMVLAAVAFIKVPKPFAGIFFTIVTKFRRGFLQEFTVDNDAFLTIFGFVHIEFPAAFAGIFIPEKSKAYPAVHAAGGDQCFPDHSLILFVKKATF
jgi:hypothetical protein